MQVIEWVVDGNNYNTLSRRRTTSKEDMQDKYEGIATIRSFHHEWTTAQFNMAVNIIFKTDSGVMFSSQKTRPSSPLFKTRVNIYRPGSWPLCIMAAFCSWKRSPSRAELLRYLSTQRRTQPSSRATKDLVVKSLTQSSKQRCTRREYIYVSKMCKLLFLSGHYNLTSCARLPVVVEKEW